MALFPCSQTHTIIKVVCPYTQYPLENILIILNLLTIPSRHFMDQPVLPSHIKHNMIVAQFLQLWIKIKELYRLASKVPPLASYLGDIRFTQTHDYNTLTLWINKNLTTLGSLIVDSGFPSFSTFQKKYNLQPLLYHYNHSELTHYTQSKQFFSKYYSLQIHTPDTLFEQICLTSSRDRGLISQLYRHLNSLSMPEKSAPMIPWEAELDCSFTTEVWNVMIDNLRKSNRAVSFRESPTKLFSRWYMTPSKIHSYPETSPVLGDVQNLVLFYTFFGAVNISNQSGKHP